MDKLLRQTRKSLLYFDRYGFSYLPSRKGWTLMLRFLAAEPVKINEQELGSDGFKQEEVESGGK